MRVELLLLTVFTVASTLSSFPKVLLISFDGFRHDLLTETLVPNIYNWAKGNSWFANGLKSQYITFTLPNHMSIVTGMYEEKHGIMSNYFYDPDRKKFFDYFNSTKTPGAVNVSMEEYWYKGDPIWLTNERSNESRKSGVYYWPTGDSSFPIAPHKPSFSKSYRKSVLKDWINDVDEILDGFMRVKNPFNFAAWYTSEPDSVLHANGFHNGELEKKLKELDELFRYLIKRLDELGLTTEINIILTTDHGHSEIKDEEHIMCIPEYLTKGLNYQLTDHMIYTDDPVLAKEIMKNLTEAVAANKFQVDFHWKEEIPERWHYKNSNRIGAIVFEPKLGSSVWTKCSKKGLEDTYGPNGTTVFHSSAHGQDPNLSEMRGLLVMGGPIFAKNLTITDIPENIDIYPFLCKILEITPSPNDGSISAIQQALGSYQIAHPKLDPILTYSTDAMSFLFILVPSMCIVGLFFAYGCRHTVCKEDPNWGRAEASRGYRPLHLPDGEDAVEDLELGRPREIRNNRNVNTGPVRMSGLLDELSDDEI